MVGEIIYLLKINSVLFKNFYGAKKLSLFFTFKMSGKKSWQHLICYIVCTCKRARINWLICITLDFFSFKRLLKKTESLKYFFFRFWEKEKKFTAFFKCMWMWIFLYIPLYLSVYLLGFISLSCISATMKTSKKSMHQP